MEERNENLGDPTGLTSSVKNAQPGLSLHLICTTMAKRAAEASLWETHKSTIYDLYMVRETPLNEVIEILDTQHGFKRT